MEAASLTPSQTLVGPASIQLPNSHAALAAPPGARQASDKDLDQAMDPAAGSGAEGSPTAEISVRESGGDLEAQGSVSEGSGVLAVGGLPGSVDAERDGVSEIDRVEQRSGQQGRRNVDAIQEMLNRMQADEDSGSGEG